MALSPSSVSAGKDIKRGSIVCTNSRSDMFSILTPSQRSSTDLDKSRTIPACGQTPPSTSEEEPNVASAAPMSEDDAKKKINEDAKEFLSVSNSSEADEYFTALTVPDWLTSSFHQHLEARKLTLVWSLTSSLVLRHNASARWSSC
ncbi:hypothetical protein EDC04DRAFT_2910251 [Pisolithus marmoratus]|nr:hypothetical protein EDC04DRAFT_2910251 [Pisolithus marmoratus]